MTSAPGARRRDDVETLLACSGPLASLALHDKETGDAPFLRALPLVERESTDGRNFVTTAVNGALR